MWPFKKKDPFMGGYNWAKENVKSPVDRAEVEGFVQKAKDFGTYNDFDKGIEKYLKETQKVS